MVSGGMQDSDKPAIEWVGDKRERVAIAERSVDGRAHFQKDEQSQKVRLWDCIDECWTTTWFEYEYALQNYLRSYAIKCSACRHTDTNESGIRSHIQMMKERAEDHRGAEIQFSAAEGKQGFICTGCAQQFTAAGKARKQANGHLEKFTNIAPLHADAQPIAVKRYELQPPNTATTQVPAGGLHGN